MLPVQQHSSLLMHTQVSGTGLPIRAAPGGSRASELQQLGWSAIEQQTFAGNSAAAGKSHKHSRSSYSESSPLASRNNSVTFRPIKRHMATPDQTIAVINASGRQAASFIRVATAVGYRVRAQLRNLEGVVATEVSSNPNVKCIVGELYTRQPSEQNRDVTLSGPINGIGVNRQLISELFRGAQLAFINTTFYGDEVQIGRAIADEAKRVRVKHFIYSSMPDHASYNPAWPKLPLWAAKEEVEKYVRGLGLPATFVYTGIYNNNFTSLRYPLFCMELQTDGSFEWRAPFHDDAKLPWLDAEQDVGPAILQIFKDGVAKWRNRRVALAFEMLTPKEACEAFARGVGRPVRYIRAPIETKVRIPTGYRQQLEALEQLFYFGGDDPTQQPPYFGDVELEKHCPEQALSLWEAPRGLEEYAREVFPLEEQANGLTWMMEEDDDENDDGNSDDGTSGVEEALANTSLGPNTQNEDDGDDEDDEDDGLVMRGLKRDEEEWLA